MNLHTRADRRWIRSGYRSNRYVMVDITAPTSRRAPSRAPLNTAFVLDRSGSMSGGKISLARRAIDAAIASLAAGDRFAIVAYDDRVEIVAPSAMATGQARHAASQALASVDARGSTNLFDGWMQGCAQVAAHQDGAPGMHRVLLMSDGHANQGVTDREELMRHAGELARRGVATWTFGFGADFDEDLMEGIAFAGGGQSYYVESPAQIQDHITSAVGEALDVVARGVELRIHAPDGVLVEPLSLFRSHRVGDTTIVAIGDLVSDQVVRLVLKVNFPFGEDGRPIVISVGLGDQDGAMAIAPSPVEFVYADGRTNDLQPRDREVDREVASLYAARARKEAALLNRRGEYAAANGLIEGVARRIRGYAGDDPELRALLDQLQVERHQVSAAMPAYAQKEMHFQASYAQRSRGFDGKARKGPEPQPR